MMQLTFLPAALSAGAQAAEAWLFSRSKSQSPADLATAVDDAIVQTDAILETFGALLRIAQIELPARWLGPLPTHLPAALAQPEQ